MPLPPVDKGKTIFSTRCAGCRNVNKILTGPALAGVDQRHPMKWIVKFVQSSQTLVKSGDKDAVALFTKFNKISMPDHKDLNEGQIKNIVEYINMEAKAAASDGTEKTPAAKPVDAPNYFALTAANTGFLVTVVALAALFMAVLLFAFQVKRYERRLNTKA